MKSLGMLRRAGWLGWSGWSGWWLGAVVLGMLLPLYGQYGPGKVSLEKLLGKMHIFLVM